MTCNKSGPLKTTYFYHQIQVAHLLFFTFFPSFCISIIFNCLNLWYIFSIHCFCFHVFMRFFYCFCFCRFIEATIYPFYIFIYLFFLVIHFSVIYRFLFPSIEILPIVLDLLLDYHFFFSGHAFQLFFLKCKSVLVALFSGILFLSCLTIMLLKYILMLVS